MPASFYSSTLDFVKQVRIVRWCTKSKVYQLRKETEAFFQIQLYLYLFNLEVADLVLFNKYASVDVCDSIVVVEVERDSSFLQKQVPDLSDYFQSNLLPSVVPLVKSLV